MTAFVTLILKSISSLNCIALSRTQTTTTTTTTTKAPVTTAAPPGTTTKAPATTTKAPTTAATTAKPATTTTRKATRDCGRTRDDDSGSTRSLNNGTRIVNGMMDAILDAPWSVHLIVGAVGCSGTLIDKCTVLTAAHCVEGLSANDITANTECRFSQTGTKCVRKSFEKVIIHENFNFPNNDIALLKFTECVTFSERIRPACLPFALPADGSNFDPTPELFPSTVTEVFGWGRTETGAFSDSLKQAFVKTVADDQCAAFYDMPSLPPGIICADEVTGNTCQGDSGGFMGRRDSEVDNRYVQYGITIFGSPTGCTAGDPHGFTEVSDFKTWILAKLGVGSAVVPT